MHVVPPPFSTHVISLVKIGGTIRVNQSNDVTCRALFTVLMSDSSYTAIEGLVGIQYKCLVPIYVFPEMKLLFPKQNNNVLSPSSYIHISVRNLFISRISLPILLHKNMWTDPGNI
jgi:hypothetical protein